jgi:DivIVA domain-containing protein
MEAPTPRQGDARGHPATIDAVVIEPRTLRQVDFRFRSRGYNPDDVDDFLERLAIGLEALHREIDEVSTGGRRPSSSSSPSPADTALAEDITEAGMRRLLQRSQAEADEMVRVARDEAAKFLAEAEARAADMVEHAPETLPVFGQARELHQELLELEARRSSLWAHVDAFERLLVDSPPLVPSAGAPHPGPVPCMHLLDATPALTAP